MLTDPRIYSNWLRAKDNSREVQGMSSLYTNKFPAASSCHRLTLTHTQTHRAWRLQFRGYLCDDFFQQSLHTMVQVPKITWNCLINEMNRSNVWPKLLTESRWYYTYGRCTILNYKTYVFTFYTFVHTSQCIKYILFKCWTVCCTLPSVRFWRFLNNLVKASFSVRRMNSEK